MPAFGSNSITVAFAETVLEKERIASGSGTEEDPYVYEKIGFRLDDRIVSALDRFIGALSRFRLPNTQLLDRWLFIYPFVGGSDWSHGLNLADVEGGFSKFAITWSGSVTHNQNGVTIGNGGQGDTNCDCADKVGNLVAYNRKSHGVYSRTAGALAGKDFLATFVEPKNGYTYTQGINLRNTDGSAYGDLCYYFKTGVTVVPNRIVVAVGSGTGFFVDSQRAGSVSGGAAHYLVRNGAQIGNESSAEISMGFGDGLGLAKMVLQGVRNFAFFFSSKHKNAISYLNLPGNNLEFYTFVQQLQVALQRAV